MIKFEKSSKWWQHSLTSQLLKNKGHINGGGTNNIEVHKF